MLREGKVRGKDGHHVAVLRGAAGVEENHVGATAFDKLVGSCADRVVAQKEGSGRGRGEERKKSGNLHDRCRGARIDVIRGE